MIIHQPVLLKEVIEILKPERGDFIIDGTVDGGGHAKAILEKIKPAGRFLGLDWDKEILERTKKRIEGKFPPNNRLRLMWLNDNFKNLPKIIAEKKLPKADGLLLDLGFSNEQIHLSGRGFSFRKDEPLLMTYNSQQKPLYQHLNELSIPQLAFIIKEFGEERFAERIARAVKKNLPVKTSGVLTEIIKRAVPPLNRHQRLHPATRTFMALRIFVNEEMENLKSILNDLNKVVGNGGKVIVISFHSLEDRLVKNVFKKMAAARQAVLLVKKPIRPAFQEIKINPVARSAKLRAIQLN